LDDIEDLKPMTLQGRTAIITGGGSGIGAAIGKALASAGVQVCLMGRRPERLQATAAAIQAAGGSASCYVADVSDERQIEQLAKWFVLSADGADILVHSAGAIEGGAFDLGTTAGFDRQYQVNVRAPYVMTKAMLPHLGYRCRGDVVFINSSAGIAGKADFAQYAATKHALKGLADSLRAEVNPRGIRVLSVYVGRTATDMQAELHAKAGDAYRPHLLLQPEDVASAVVSDLSLPRTAEVTDIHIRPLRKS
jgi:NADP-dependent 3-hydroxy acid dehydrogenase YdfG